MNAAKLRTSLPAKSANIFIWLFLVAACVFVVTPLLFMFSASFMPAIDIMKLPYPWVTDHIHWENYWNGLRGPDGSFMFLRNTLNSLVVALSVTETTVILSSLSGYDLARFKFKGRNAVFMLIMATMMIPFKTIVIPLYMVTMKMRLQDSYAGLILPFLTNAFGVFLMRQFLLTFPDEVLDAARIDGASEPRVFTHIVLPDSGPAIATLAILTFCSQWDDLLWPLLVVQSDEMKTIPLYITKFMAETHSDGGIMMAVAVMASLPMFILFFTTSRYFISTEGPHSTIKG
jgi:multiple sugar transport system permease protein